MGLEMKLRISSIVAERIGSLDEVVQLFLDKSMLDQICYHLFFTCSFRKYVPEYMRDGYYRIHFCKTRYHKRKNEHKRNRDTLIFYWKLVQNAQKGPASCSATTL